MFFNILDVTTSTIIIINNLLSKYMYNTFTKDVPFLCAVVTQELQ